MCYKNLNCSVYSVHLSLNGFLFGSFMFHWSRDCICSVWINITACFPSLFKYYTVLFGFHGSLTTFIKLISQWKLIEISLLLFKEKRGEKAVWRILLVPWNEIQGYKIAQNRYLMIF